MVSHVGVIEKRGQLDHYYGHYLIIDLSHPSGHSMNDGVSPGRPPLRYFSVDDAERHIL